MPWMTKRDGSVVYAIRNPDGSWLEAPPDFTLDRLPVSPHVREFLRAIGRKGGKARARRHSPEELAAWGRMRHKKAAKSPVSDLPCGENQEVNS
jgi:hypothetical protein